MDSINLSTPEAHKKPCARQHALSPATAVAETSFIDLTKDSPSLVSFCSRAAPGGPPLPSRRCVDSRQENVRYPSLTSLPRTNRASSATHGAFSHVPVTHLLPRRKVSRPFLDPWLSGKENSDPSSGSNAWGLSPIGVKTSKSTFLSTKLSSRRNYPVWG